MSKVKCPKCQCESVLFGDPKSSKTRGGNDIIIAGMICKACGHKFKCEFPDMDWYDAARRATNE